MEIIVVVYKQRDRIDFIGKTISKRGKKGNPVTRLTHLGTKIYRSAIQRRKEEMQLDQGYEPVFSEV